MKKILGLFALLTLSTLPTTAQLNSSPKLEVGGGYMYRSYNVQFISRANENGWFATADYNVMNWLGIDADFDGGYTTIQGTTTRQYTYLFGPQVYPIGHHRITPFVHALFGGSSFKFPQISGANDNAFAFALGGGVDWSATQHIAVRLAQFDYEQTRNFGGGTTGNPNQNNYKVKVGVIFTF
jgi:opacity protein-like surface antigen